jgi:[acyl-carrier-protein] S-malonyltransferase
MDNGKNAFIFPGQGAQRVLMGKDFYDAFRESKDVFDLADEILGYKLSKIIFEGPIEELTKTIYSQPAIFVTSVAILKAFESRFPYIQPTFAAGLSLGEYSALFAAKKASFEDLLKLCAVRASLMQKACEKYPGVMLCVMGLDLEKVKMSNAYVANINCPNQIVVAAAKENVADIEKNLQNLGAKRIIPLQVSGGFHSPLMNEAKDELRGYIESTHFECSDIRLLMNVTGDFVESVDSIKTNLIQQVAAPTQWMSSILAMEKEGVANYFELGPSQLQGINKKIGVMGKSISIDKVSDLERVNEEISK